MSDSWVAAVIYFIIAWIISSLIIYLITKLFGEKERFGTALSAAFIGSIIYTLAYIFIGSGLLAAVVGGVVWWIALGILYQMSWFKALGIAIVVWMVATVVGWFLPTVGGPL